MVPGSLYLDDKCIIGRGNAHELERDLGLGFSSRAIRVRVYTGKLRKVTHLTVVYAPVNANSD